MLDGIKLFTDYADVYGDSINDTRTAEKFFKEFLTKTGGSVNVDYLDSDNDDRISAVDYDHDEGFIRICTRIPETNSEMRAMRKMVLSFDTYSILVRLKNIRFVRVKDNKCIGVVVNGFTVHRKDIEREVGKRGNKIINLNEASSFFSTNLLMELNGEYELMRAMKTPITSFWIIPKDLYITPQDSESLLYEYNVESLSKRLSFSWGELGDRLKATKDKDKEFRERYIKDCGNGIRDVAEGLFKLMACFYHERHHLKFKEYNCMRLGDLINPLKRHIYTSEDDANRLNRIERIANELSHDSGLPVKISDLGELYLWLKFYMEDFDIKIDIKDNKSESELEIQTKPSPGDYIQQNLKVWNFSDQISKLSQHTPNLHFRLKVHPQVYYVDLFSTKDDYLCKDGSVRTLGENDLSEALELTSREDVIELVTKINNVVKTDCVAKGYDGDSAFLSFSYDMIRGCKPVHLFSLEEIKTLMRNADDNKNNTLVIDEEGYAHIVNNDREELLYPVSQGTWCAGNGYVGWDSSLSDAKPSYRLCLELWLAYLQTGIRQYDDDCPAIDVDKTIEEIKKFY